MKYLLGLFYWLVTPAVLLVLAAGLKSYLISSHRVKRERKLFHSAIDSDNYEGRHFVQMSLLLGVLGSLVSLVTGVTVPLSLVVIYPIVALILLVVVPQSVTLLTLLATVGIMAFDPTNFTESLTGWLTKWGYQTNNLNLVGTLGLATIVVGGLAFFVRRNAGQHLSPKIEFNKRNTMIAVYPFNELSVVPLLVLVPGNWFSTHLPWWPLLNLGGHSVALVGLPLVIGLGLTVKHSLPTVFFQRLGKQLAWLTLLGAILTIACRFFTQWSLIALLAYLIVGIILVVANIIYDRQQAFSNSQVMNGIRIIGIQPNSPAAKMNLVVGDVILEVNGQKVTNEDDFYKALITNATYCHLKVRDRNDQLKVTETAIFQGAAHEIGIKVFPENTK
ncbi:PDZ domain-containing protein [Lentilactobacillus senioris]|uniref:PDZ domain-containing protein n=1 Tax=Lentilactobacillus senioris TaxID=931534 RepID=UPI00227ECDB8|nr:PDZ domain-containing protein [Lentilactobacillus senioris]MCY9807186.1 PDZ domain-containing protein [Lentilactobacillus senioris]